MTSNSKGVHELWWLSRFFFGFLAFVFGLACWDQFTHRLPDLWTTAPEGSSWSAAVAAELTAWALAPVVAALVLLRGRERWRALLPGWAETLEEHAAWIDDLPRRHLWWLIALAAGAGLFAELSIIRLHGSFIQLFAYFKNVSLLSCFLGLGLGYARAGRGLLWTPLLLPLMTCQLLGLDLLRTSSTTDYLENPISEQVLLGLTGDAPRLVGSVAGLALLALVFAFNALCFVPFGQVAGRLMARTERLSAYGWNLLGSIVGVGLFNLLAMAWTPPPVWMFFVALSVVPLLARRHQLPTLVAGLCLVTGLGWLGLSTTEKDVYSPYQKLTIQQERDKPPTIQVANVYFQRMVDLRETDARFDDGTTRLQASVLHYELPYQVHQAPERVLVVGAGTGNDVAAALRNDAGLVHAVEIDPVILDLGRELHPEAPYSAHEVVPVVNDARAFLRDDRRTYDVIVYGLLDSHTLLSSAASVRLDSFVYTVEGFREARDRLAPGGVLSLSFTLVDDRLGFKIFGMLKQAFDGVEPLVFGTQYDDGLSFAIGEGLTEADLPPALAKRIDHEFARRAAASEVDLSTDDWPFFYMPERTYPVSYVVMVAVLIAVSFFLVGRFLRGERQASWPCFFLGAGFMLVETKGITELALVYGSTWIVVGLVIVAILTLAYLANLLVAWRGLPSRALSYGLLLASVLGGLALISLDLGAMDLWTQRLVLTAGLTLPLFFSGLAFSSELVRAPSIQAALSANLLGAMLGGFLEYNAMYFGYRALYLLAIAVYAAAWFASTRAR